MRGRITPVPHDPDRRRLEKYTLGDVADGLARYRPFVLVVVGILLAVVGLPKVDGTAPLAASSAVDAPVPGSAPEPSAASAGVAADGATNAAAASVSAAANSATPVSAARQVVAATGRKLTSTDALTAPDCDQTTGRIKIPSFYAPNCVGMWAKGSDNGGATYKGVTKDTITVAYYLAEQSTQVITMAAAAGSTDTTPEPEDDANREKVLEAFHAHYETYGRKVRLVKVKASGPPEDAQAAKADAVRVALELKAFASLGDPSRLAGGSSAYVEELVARGVMCIGCTYTQQQPNYLKWAPHVWVIPAAYDQNTWHIAEYVGKRIWGRKARWAGDPVLQQRQRVLGFVAYNTNDGTYDSGPEIMTRYLEMYGAKLSVAVSYPFDLGAAQEQARTAIARMKDAGVTTIIVGTDPFYPVFFTQEATRQQYFPEWASSGAAGTDTTFFARTYDQTQWSHAFGVANVPVALTSTSSPGTDPNFVDWHCGCELTSYPNQSDFSLLFAGLQMAGPKLTPQAFRDGMFALKPARGYVTRVGWSFGKGVWPWDDYTMLDDMAEFWYDAQAMGSDGRPGTVRYVDMGKRWLPDKWPTTDPRLFDPANTVIAYAERPVAERVPEYEHKHYR